MYINRELKMVGDRQVEFYKYGKQFIGGRKLVKRLVTSDEAEMAKEIIARNNWKNIERFCRSIG